MQHTIQWPTNVTALRIGDQVAVIGLAHRDDPETFRQHVPAGHRCVAARWRSIPTDLVRGLEAAVVWTGEELLI